ncbi:hypothetical protein C8Q70DRAFT_1046820 [Cubamyces menziesii]|nr:hypothetical protein C8Q70DRAFT_1046820 [Cubamyces menziesii]
MRSLVSASLVNVTIDDTFGDASNGAQIIYEPDSVWNIGNNCAACTAHPDPGLVYDGTWHDGTTQLGSEDLLTAAVGFSGVAVYVFCVVTRSEVSPDGNSDMSFFIDGEQAGQYVVPPDGDTSYAYNVPVFVKDGLAAGSHQLLIVNGRTGGNKSLVLLDYIIYRSVMSPRVIKREPN